MPEYNTWVAIYRAANWCISKLPGIRKSWARAKDQFRDRLQKQTASIVHKKFIHSLRDYLVHASVNQTFDSPGAVRMLDEAAGLMQHMASGSTSTIHACLKLLAKNPGDSDDPYVYTLSRSNSGYASGRGRRLGSKWASELSKNTAFCAIIGHTDGRRGWQKTFDSFSCNDLLRYGDDFVCGREDWRTWYQSTLVYPIRCHPPGQDYHVHLGFLTFDTENLGGFPGVPCSFDFTTVDDYTHACEDSAMWNIGALMADSLAMALWPYLMEQPQGEM